MQIRNQTLRQIEDDAQTIAEGTGRRPEELLAEMLAEYSAHQEELDRAY